MTTELTDQALRRAASKGAEAFVQLVANACRKALGPKMTAENMEQLNTDQHTLLAYMTLREELLEGGFCQLIQNGQGPYIFRNPLPRALRAWGLDEMANLVYDARRVYDAHREELERKRTDEEFMAMYEEFDAFDPMEDKFIEHEEEWTETVARYVDEHLERFVRVVPGDGTEASKGEKAAKG